MEHTKEEVKTAEGQGKEEIETCVCNMEWRGTHGDEWGDCVCYPDDQVKTEN